MSSELAVPNDRKVEQVWAEISHHGSRIIIGAAYIPPASDESCYVQVADSCKFVTDSMASDDHVFFLGDFNRPSEWLNDSENPVILRPTVVSPTDEIFFDALAARGLSKVCGIRTRNQLEPIFTDIDSDLEAHDASHPLKRNSHHHASTEVSFTTRSFILLDEEAQAPLGFDFRRADVYGLADAMADLDWTSELNGDEVD